MITQVAGHTVVERAQIVPYCDIARLPLKANLNLGDLGLLNRQLDQVLSLLCGVAMDTLGVAVADKQTEPIIKGVPDHCWVNGAFPQRDEIGKLVCGRKVVA